MTALAIEPKRKARAPLALLPHPGYELVLEEVRKGRSIEQTCKRLRARGVRCPSPARFVEWATSSPERHEEYMRARRTGAELGIDQLASMLDGALVDDDGNPITEPAVLSARVAIAREKAQNHKWYVSKIMPKLYGDKLQHEHSGSLSVTVATGVDLLGASPSQRIGVSLDSLLDGEDVRDAAVRVLPAAPASTAAPVASPARLGGDAFDALD